MFNVQVRRLSSSKSKHLYVLDEDGLKLDYNTNKFLVGTPALGNLDDDDDLEIVFGCFSSSPKLYAVNIDGSDVEGFPIDLEKTYVGFALADFNGNVKDDILISNVSSTMFLKCMILEPPPTKTTYYILSF